MMKQPKSDIIAAVHETAGVLPTRTLREFDALCLTPQPGQSAPDTEERRQELENDTHE